MKGTAFYIKNLDKLSFYKDTFRLNGPMISLNEAAYSAYYTLLSITKHISFHDDEGECEDEFEYINSCASELEYIDLAQVQGALHTVFC